MVKLVRKVVKKDVVNNDNSDDNEVKEKEEDFQYPTNVEKLDIVELATTKEFIPRGWETVFEQCEEEFDSISEIIESDEKKNGKCFPLRCNIFRIFHMCSPDKVKVLIIGQDPYHNRCSTGDPAATGVAFSTWIDEKKQPSVMNIHKVVKDCYPNFVDPGHGNLDKWVEEEGVFLMNTSHTVAPGKPDSHSEIWMGFSSKVVKHLVELKGKKLIVMLWGKKAQRLVGKLVSSATILETSHPSPYSAKHGFLESKIFKNANDILDKFGIEQVNWCNL